MKAQLDHINMTVKNLKESIAWYEKYFGFQLVESGKAMYGPYGIIKNGSSMLCMHERPKRQDMGDSTAEKYHRLNHFALAIDNKPQWEKLFKNENFTTTYPSPVSYPHSTSWYVADPSGHEIEVVHWNTGVAQFSGT